MDKKELKKEIMKICYGNSYRTLHATQNLADQILSLINAERCVWTRDEDGDWDTECGRCYDHDEVNMPAGYCNGCGKRIEVKDG